MKITPSACVFLTLVLGGHQIASAQSYPEVLFVLDASGSMQETAGSVTKMAAAKQVMQQIVPELNPQVRVGLVAYGHRHKGDCADIEVLLPPGSTDRDALLKSVQSLEPRGLTPISDALSMSIDLLKLKESETTVVLVSDGKETCHADPCKVVRKLKATGIKFVLHVVGFQVDQKARQQLECLAGEGGGKYLHASDPAGLQEALKNIEEQIEVAVKAAESQSVPVRTGLGRIVLTQPEKTVRSMDGLQIVRIKDEKVIKTTGRLPVTSNHPLMDGAYQVHYTFAQPNFGKPVQVALGKVDIRRGTDTRIALGGIEFNIDKTLEKGAPVVQVLITDSGSKQLVAVANDNSNGYYNFLAKALLPGLYDVSIRYARSLPGVPPTVVARQVSVAAGKCTLVTLDSGIRIKQASGTHVTGWDLIPVPARLETKTVADGSPEAGSAVQPRRGRDNQYPIWAAFVVRPGHYQLQVHIRGMTEPLVLEDNLEIKPGQLIEYDAGL